MSKLNSIESNPERKLAIRINVVQSGCNRSVSNNVVSFSRNVVLSDPLFSIKVVSKPRMLSVRAVYVLSSYEADVVKPLIKFFV